MSEIVKVEPRKEAFPLFGLLLGILGAALAVFVSVCVADPNSASTTSFDFYLRSGALFLVPVAVVALLIYACSEGFLGPDPRPRKVEQKLLVDSIGSLVMAVGFIGFGFFAMGYYEDVEMGPRAVHLLASIIMALPFAYDFIDKMMVYCGSETTYVRRIASEAILLLGFGTGPFLKVAAIYFSPYIYDFNRIEFMNAYSIVMWIVIVLSLLPPVVSFLVAYLGKDGERREKGMMFGGVLLAILSVALFIESFLIYDSGLFLYTFYYWAMFMGLSAFVACCLLCVYAQFADKLPKIMPEKLEVTAEQMKEEEEEEDEENEDL